MTDSEKRRIVRDFQDAVIRRGNWEGCAIGINDRMRFDECEGCQSRPDCATRARYEELNDKVRTTQDALRALHGFTN